jgi:chemotaxis protein histidine kinase CheA
LVPPGAADRNPQGLQACLDELEQVLLHADTQSARGIDTSGARRCLEFVAAHLSGQDAPGASLLADRLLALVQALAQGVARPTSAVLDTLHRAVDGLRALAWAESEDDPETELEGLLVELQALTGGAAAADDAQTMALEHSATELAAPGSQAAGFSGDAFTLRQTAAADRVALDAMLATLGPLVNAQAGLVQAVRAQLTPLPAPLERSAALVDGCIQDTAKSLAAWRSVHGPDLPSAPELLEVIAVRAAASICLVPAAAVLGCAAASTQEPSDLGTDHATAGDDAGGADDAEGADDADTPIDLRGWLAQGTQDTGSAANRPQTPPWVLTVWAGAGQRTWLVDEVLFQRTVAVQPLETHFRKVPGVAGVAVLGEMGICLLLDTDEGPLAQPGSAPPTGGEARVR